MVFLNSKTVDLELVMKNKYSTFPDHFDGNNEHIIF